MDEEAEGVKRREGNIEKGINPLTTLPRSFGRLVTLAYGAGLLPQDDRVVGCFTTCMKLSMIIKHRAQKRTGLYFKSCPSFVPLSPNSGDHFRIAFYPTVQGRSLPGAWEPSLSTALPPIPFTSSFFLLSIIFRHSC